MAGPDLWSRSPFGSAKGIEAAPRQPSFDNFVLRIHHAFKRRTEPHFASRCVRLYPLLTRAGAVGPLSQTMNSVGPARPLRKMLRRLGVLCSLLVLPTAVLAYADLLPES